MESLSHNESIIEYTIVGQMSGKKQVIKRLLVVNMIMSPSMDDEKNAQDHINPILYFLKSLKI